MKTILLPTDFSRNAWNALFTALKLYHDQQCLFVLLHTFEPELANILGDRGEKRLGTIYESLEAESAAKMKEITDYLEKNHQNPRHRFQVLCRPGDLVSVVRHRMETHPADMIVMGTQGATGAERVFLGSNTVRMLKTIRNKPIIAVPESYDFQWLRDVIFPTDYLHLYEPFELRPLIDLLTDWKATLHVVYAAREFALKPKQESNKALLRTRFEGHDVRFSEIPLDKTLSKTLTGYCEGQRADLLALMHHKHSIFEGLAKEKVVNRIAFDSKIPLLILPQFL